MYVCVCVWFTLNFDIMSTLSTLYWFREGEYCSWFFSSDLTSEVLQHTSLTVNYMFSNLSHSKYIVIIFSPFSQKDVTILPNLLEVAEHKVNLYAASTTLYILITTAVCFCQILLALHKCIIFRLTVIILINTQV
jgi:hypothetical protein